MPHDIARIARDDGRFAPEALAFLAESFRRATDLAGGPRRHLTAAELTRGVVDLAAERWGLLADLVLMSWGIRSPAEIGAVTWLLIEHGIFSRQDDDRPEDFRDLGELLPLVRERVAKRIGLPP
jgi:uncharacterized repeat protein (TIGR04138 family)